MSKWIKVSDQLPNDKDKVWIYVESAGFVTDAMFYSVGDSFFDGYTNYPDVTHWAPYVTPEPPVDRDWET